MSCCGDPLRLSLETFQELQPFVFFYMNYYHCLLKLVSRIFKTRSTCINVHNTIYQKWHQLYIHTNWCIWYNVLFYLFYVCLKFSPRILINMALHILHTLDHEEFHVHTMNKSCIQIVDDLFLYVETHDKTWCRLLQTTCRLSWSPFKEHHVYILMVFYLKNIDKGFQLDE